MTDTLGDRLVPVRCCIQGSANITDQHRLTQEKQLTILNIFSDNPKALFYCGSFLHVFDG
jgi:hypothetical protein